MSPIILIRPFPVKRLLVQGTDLFICRKYRVIQNYFRGFNNLSYTIHLR